jgi:hypothetical protein
MITHIYFPKTKSFHDISRENIIISHYIILISYHDIMKFDEHIHVFPQFFPRCALPLFR